MAAGGWRAPITTESPAAAKTRTVLIPLPRRDFDPSEVAVPWQMLRAAGMHVVFATPDGAAASADDLMLTGEGLDPWGWIPGLKKIRLLGLSLRANADARAAYQKLLAAPEFRAPQSYALMLANGMQGIDGVLFPGGHRARGMREYLESAQVQQLAVAAFAAARPVAAICHGVLVLARSRNPGTGHSVLHGRRTTALTWALEKKAWDATRWFGRFWDPSYYRTYPDGEKQPAGFMSVQAEVTRALARPEDFRDVADDAPQGFRKRSGLFRDRIDDDRAAWVVRDGNYVSARWPGDVHAFTKAFIAMLTSL